VSFDDSPCHSGWDKFLERTPGGHHLQTSLWGQVKATVGWRATRVLVRADGEIIAGCQMLVRASRVGAVAYVARGPVAADRHPDIFDNLMRAVRRLARERRVIHLTVQPPVDRHDMPALLTARGFAPSPVEAAPSATTCIDLQRPRSELFAAMRPSKRRKIRQAQRQGIVVRRGGRSDLPTFHRLLWRTAQRQGFVPYPLSYYEQMWRSFESGGHVALFVAEHEGTAQAAQLLIGFGDTIIGKVGGWSGSAPALHPNELLDWTSIAWAKEQGYRYFDFEGVHPSVARAAAAGQTPRTDAVDGPTVYKLGFGGSLVLFPEAYYVPNGALGWALDRLLPFVARGQMMDRALRTGSLRMRASAPPASGSVRSRPGAQPERPRR
jgi:lipid II:glycine glycyltransferase (peptidoglycan interpeptide bridge formation enzyme)